MSNYFFTVANGIVTDSAMAGEFTGTGWIYSGTNKVSPGMYYNHQIKKCYWPCRFPSWVQDPDTGHFNAPVPKPNDENNYIWNEAAQTWEVTSDIAGKLPYEMRLPVYDIP